MSDLQPVYDDLVEELLSFNADDLVAPPMGWDPAALDFTWDLAALDFTWDPADLAHDPQVIADLGGKLAGDKQPTPARRRARRAPRGRR